MADQKHRTRPRPKRGAAVIALVLGVLGIASGVASVLFDLGWVVWVLALIAVGLAVCAAMSGTRLLLVVGVVALVVVVVGGVVWARSAPPLPPDARSLPVFRPDGDADHVTEMDRDDDVFIVSEHRQHAIVGYSAEGDRLWTSEAGYGTGPRYAGSRYAELTGDSVITYGSGKDASPAVLLSATTGGVEWTADVGRAEAFTANDEVIVFADSDRTFALDRESGASIWELDAEAVASSRGQSPYDWREWSPHADWLVVGDRTLGVFQVVDARSGETALEFQLESRNPLGRWVIAGDTFVTFGYAADGRPVALGQSLKGGRDWSTGIHGLEPGAFYEPFNDAVRIVQDHEVQWLDSRTGELRIVEVPTQWSIGSGRYSPDGARTLIAENRDRDSRRVALFDSVTGELTELVGPHARGARVLRGTETGSLLSLPYLDAVGSEHERLVLIPD